MGSAKYVGMDVHKDTISIAVMNSAGKLIMESIIKASGEHKEFVTLKFSQVKQTHMNQSRHSNGHQNG
jgi:hypothetical protein